MAFDTVDIAKRFEHLFIVRVACSFKPMRGLVQISLVLQGVALKMLTCLEQHVRKTQDGVQRILLICKAYLIPLYTRAGFTLVGESNIILGKFCCHIISHTTSG